MTGVIHMPQTRMSAKEYQEMLRRKKAPKYHNKKVYVYEDGFVSPDSKLKTHGEIVEIYDSVKEYTRSRELLLLKKAGRISGLKRQAEMVIQEGFTTSDGKKRAPVIYKADFVYERDGETIVEDVKGQDKKTGKLQMTEAFRLKWKLLQAKYPQYKFELY